MTILSTAYSGDECAEFRVEIDELRDEPAPRHDLVAGGTHVLERVAHETFTEPEAAPCMHDLGVREHDAVVVEEVVGDADELAVEPDLVPRLRRVLLDRDRAIDRVNCLLV